MMMYIFYFMAKGKQEKENDPWLTNGFNFLILLKQIMIQ